MTFEKRMVKVKVRILRGPLREIIDKGEVSVQSEKHVRVIDVLNLMENKYGKPFRDFVFDPKTNKINSNLMFALNGVHIGCINGIETPIENDSELLILTATGGG